MARNLKAFSHMLGWCIILGEWQADLITEES